MMGMNTRIAGELIRIAKSLVAAPVDDWNGDVNGFEDW